MYIILYLLSLSPWVWLKTASENVFKTISFLTDKN